MVTRAYVEDVDLTNSRVKVRIPIFDGVQNSVDSTINDYNLCWASLVWTPGINVDYRVGDVVVVSFEDNNIGRPIVIGYLKLIGSNDDSKIYATIKELNVSDSFSSPTDSRIGVTDYSEIYESINTEKRGPGVFSSSVSIDDSSEEITISVSSVNNYYDGPIIVGDSIIGKALDGSTKLFVVYKIEKGNSSIDDILFLKYSLSF